MRKLFIALLILSISQYVAAQSPRFRVRAGANLFILHSSNDKTQDYSNARVGYTAGVTLEMFINKHFSIQPELNYSHQEARENYYGSNLSLEYTQLPILFRYHTANGKAVLYAGPQLGFLGAANIKEDNGKETGVAYKFNKTDFGIAFGVAHVPPKNGMTFDFEYTGG